MTAVVEAVHLIPAEWGGGGEGGGREYFATRVSLSFKRKRDHSTIRVSLSRGYGKTIPL